MDVANREGKQQHRFDVTGAGGEVVQLAAASDAKKREWMGAMDAGERARPAVEKAEVDLRRAKEQWQREDQLMAMAKYDMGMAEADFSNKNLGASDAIVLAAFLPKW